MPANTATIQVRIDRETKKQALTVLDKLHVNMSEAIKMFLRQVALTNSIPFDLKVPSELTAKTMNDVEMEKDLHKASSVDKLFEELDN